MIALLESGDLDISTPITDLVIDSLQLEPALADRLFTALVSSPAMNVLNGVPSIYEGQCKAKFGTPLRDIVDLKHHERIDNFLGTIATSFYVFEVGRAPLKHNIWRRPKCEDLYGSPGGHEINAFLDDPALQQWTSANWTARDRDAAQRYLRQADESVTVDQERVRIPKCGTQQLRLTKNDNVWSAAIKRWTDKRQRYYQMLQQMSDAGFLQGSRYAFLRSGDLKRMEDRSGTSIGPLRGQKFFILGALQTMRETEVSRLLKSYGGRLVKQSEIDGPDVLAIVGNNILSSHECERGDLRYWQLRQVTEPGLVDWLNTMQAPTSSLPQTQKRKREEGPQPLDENDNLAGLGPRKRPTTEKNGTSRTTTEVVDLC